MSWPGKLESQGGDVCFCLKSREEKKKGAKVIEARKWYSSNKVYT